MRIRLYAIVVAALAVCLPMTWVAAQPPIEPTPGYDHDRFLTDPPDHTYEFQAYIASFDTNDDDDNDGLPESRGIPEWVAYQLNEGTPQGAPSKPSKWRKVPELSVGTLSPTDDSYRNSCFSRGHMCMRNHAHRLGSAANYHTFNVMNACPQQQLFNAGHWLGLENLTGKWADLYGTVWIICGPIFHDGTPSDWVGDQDEIPVAVPDAFFKIVVRESDDRDRPHVLAFVYDHDESLNSSSEDVDHTEFLVSVDAIEAQTGLNFLTSLPDAIEEDIENAPAPELWSTEIAEDIEPAPLRLAASEEDAAGAIPEYVNGEVTFIPDGDTLHVTQGNALFKIRLHGIDCPESDQPFGAEARQRLAGLVDGETVTVVVKERNRYGRFVGEVFIDGQSANRELARDGLAWWYKQYAEGDLDLKRLVYKAKSAQLGLWSQRDPIPPWEWRAGR